MFLEIHESMSTLLSTFQEGIVSGGGATIILPLEEGAALVEVSPLLMILSIVAISLWFL